MNFTNNALAEFREPNYLGEFKEPEKKFPILFNTHNTHVFIPAQTGRGKSTLAKIILQQNNADHVLVLSESNDWDNPSQDLKDLETMFSAAKLINSDPNNIQALFIVVFDDFNNQDNVNMWNNKLIQRVFNHGRKFNLHCLLLAHSVTQTGKKLRSACSFTIFFRPSGRAELQQLAQDFLYGDVPKLLSLFDKCTGRYDCVISDGHSCIPVRPNIVTMTFDNINDMAPTFNVDRFTNNYSDPNLRGMSGHMGHSSGHNSSNPNTQGMSMGNCSNINGSVSQHQSNYIQTQSIETKQMRQAQKLNYEMTKIKHKQDAKIKKIQMGYRLMDLLAQNEINCEERKQIIYYLNHINKTNDKITKGNWQLYSAYFLKFHKKPISIPVVNNTRSLIDRFQEADGDHMTFGLNVAKDYIPDFLGFVKKKLTGKKKIPKSRRLR